MFGRAITFLSGVSLIIIGLLLHVAPAQVLSVFGHPSAPALPFYGGFHIGMGVLCLMFLHDRSVLVNGLLYQVVLYFSLVVTQVLGMLREAGQGSYWLLGAEASALVLTFVAWSFESRIGNEGLLRGGKGQRALGGT